jgi:hypothetical protein
MTDLPVHRLDTKECIRCGARDHLRSISLKVEERQSMDGYYFRLCPKCQQELRSLVLEWLDHEAKNSFMNEKIQ